MVGMDMMWAFKDLPFMMRHLRRWKRNRNLLRWRGRYRRVLGRELLDGWIERVVGGKFLVLFESESRRISAER
jgi:hypothetical protein